MPFVFATMLFACNRKMQIAEAQNGNVVQANAGQSIPACIQHAIDSLQQKPVSNPPSQVDEYEYNGERVYGLSVGCCDMFYTIYNANCEYVCSPSGGFTGKGDGLCTTFSEKAKLLRVVWKDARKK